MRYMMNDMNLINPELPVPSAEKRFWGGWATAGFGALIIFALFACMIFVMVIMTVVIALVKGGNSLNITDLTHVLSSYLGLIVSVSGMVAYALGTGLTLIFIKVKGGAGIAEYLGLRRISWKVVLTLILIAALFVSIDVLVSNVSHAPETDSKMMFNIYDTSIWPVLLWILVVVFAPIFEEMLFRGFLFEGLIRSWPGLLGTVLLTSLVWTGLHAGYGIYSLGTIFVIGIIMGFMRYKTGSLWSTMLMHALYNGAGMTLIALHAG
jgi:uncharacterized protein